MKNVCLGLAIFFLIIGGIALITSFGHTEGLYFASMFLGAALISGIAYSHLNNQELILAAVSRPSNPLKGAALEISVLFLTAKLDPKSKINIKNHTGNATVDIDGNFIVKNIEFELCNNNSFNFHKYNYKYNCIMTFNGGDLYSPINWICTNLIASDRFSGKPLVFSEEKKEA